MGYTTSFDGQFSIEPPITREHRAILWLNYRDDEWDVPRPDAYCQWVPTDDGTGLRWDGEEKFYNYGQWLEYLVGYLGQRGYRVSGSVHYQGEDAEDSGTLSVRNGVVHKERALTAEEASAKAAAEAQGRIAALEAEMERLTRERDEAVRHYDHLSGILDDSRKDGRALESRAAMAERDRDAAKAEAARYRYALEEIQSGDHQGCPNSDPPDGDVECKECVIERALSPAAPQEAS